MSNTHQIQVEIVPTHSGTPTAAFLLQYKGKNVYMSDEWCINLVNLIIVK